MKRGNQQQEVQNKRRLPWSLRRMRAEPDTAETRTSDYATRFPFLIVLASASHTTKWALRNFLVDAPAKE